MLLLLFLLWLLTPSNARAEEVLARRLSVSFREIPLKQALDEVAKLAEFEWSYNANILDPRKRVSLQARDWTVREILHELLGDGYAFKINGQYLILKKQKAPKKELSGVVRDPKTGERLANVTLYDRKTLRATTTDSSGYYRLKVKGKSEVVVARLGYRDTVLQVSSVTPRYQKIALTPVELPAADTTSLRDKWRKTVQQTVQQTASELEAFFDATRNKWHDLNVPDTLQRRFQLSFLPYLGTNHVLSGKVENNISINILAGQSRAVQGTEVAGLANFTQKEVNGVQAAGLFNINRGTCRGVQAAGLMNQTADTLSGVQAAGLVNITRFSPHFSVQAAGLVNIIRKSDTDTPVQHAVQASGLVNSVGALQGVQAAGLVNKADDIDGAQVSGAVNIAKRVRGVQIGLVNHTNDLRGVQIGLINRSGKRWLPFFNWGNSRF